MLIAFNILLFLLMYVDVDECLNNNGGCSHKCVNMAGTHRCECPAGSTLHSNGRDCTGKYI